MADSGGRISSGGLSSAMQLGGSPVQPLRPGPRDGVADVVWTLPGNTPQGASRGRYSSCPHDEQRRGHSKAYWEYVQTVAPDEFKDTQSYCPGVSAPAWIHTVDKPVKSVADMKA